MPEIFKRPSEKISDCNDDCRRKWRKIGHKKSDA